MFSAADNNTNVLNSDEFLQNAENGTTQALAKTDLSVARYLVFGPIFLFSVAGNTLVIMTVLLLRKMKTVPMIFIANLAACDLTTTISSIAFDLPITKLDYWPYGAALCKIIYPLATLSTNAAAFTLVAISIDRYSAIICPLNLRFRITSGKCYKMIFTIYCVAFFAVVPYAVVLTYGNDEAGKPSCDENWWDPRAAKIYTVVLFLLQYGIPLVVMSVAYVAIGFKLFKNTRKAAALTSAGHNGTKPRQRMSFIPRKRTHNNTSTASNASLQKRRRQNLKTARMFLFVVVIFLVFMMPHQLLWLSYDYLSHTTTFIENEDVIAFVCGAFTYANSVLNVIVYGVCNGNFRRGCFSIIKCHCSKASQRRLERRRRTESLSIANRRGHLKRHNSSCRSTNSVDSYNGSALTRKECTSGSLRREVLQKNVDSNGTKNSPAALCNGNVDKQLTTNLKRSEDTTEINGNLVYARQSSLARENTSELKKDLLGESETQNSEDPSYWLSETEALLHRLGEEIDDPPTGERPDCLFGKSHQGMFWKANHENYENSLLWCRKGSLEKETIL